MADRTIVALYDRLDDAHAAMHELVDMGIPQDAITVGIRDAEGYRLDKSAQATTAASRRISAGDFISALGNLYIPEDDADLYAEAVRRGGILLTARVAEDQIEHAMEILERHNPLDIDARESVWRSQGWSRFDATAVPYTDEQITEERARYMTTTSAAPPTPDIIGVAPATPAARHEAKEEAKYQARREGEQAIPVVEEELQVGKRRVGGGRIRVHTFVVETPVQEKVELREETVHVERRPVDRPVEGIPPEALQEKTIEVTETREEPVISKTARVTEEVVVSKDVETHTETVSDKVRHTEVEIEDERAGKGSTGKRPAK